LVNDRVDVALAVGADGVHLPEQGLDIASVRRLARQSDFLVGVSTHSPDGAGAAARDGADLVFLGPIFATPTKRSYGPPLGLDAVSAAARAVREARPAVKLYAIGGIASPDMAAELRLRGAHGIAAVRAFMGGEDPGATAAALADVLRP
jgi:thiamine-phosphate pyrophosphorylase